MKGEEVPTTNGISQGDQEPCPKDIDFRKASLQRIALIIGIILTVCLVVHITPMPEEYFESCERPCHELDWPMICRVKLTLEVYKSLSRACKGCPNNSSDCDNDFCVSVDGHSRGILTANRLLPGPPIQVCENDIMVVDVVNRVPGQGVTLHWRGQPQVETPFMDGVPMITQCPIPSYTTFQYKFRASAPGTHLYHAHSGAEASDGLFGAFVVRQADKLEPQKKHYDYDLNDHVMVISEWSHGFAIQSILDPKPLSVKSVLVNGKGLSLENNDQDAESPAPLSVFAVKPGKKYRFRVAYAGGVKGCPITLKVENHTLQLIALDGHPVVPNDVTSIILGRGERADFVLHSNQEVDSYWIKVSTVENCLHPIFSAAVLKYEGKEDKEETTEVAKVVKSENVMNTVAGEKCVEEKTLCVDEVRSLNKMPEELRRDKMETTIYLPFSYKKTENQPQSGAGEVDGVTFTFPSSPLLTQNWDVPKNAVCTKETCEIRDSRCECVHVHKIPLGNTVDLVLADLGGESDHIFHLHGYSFYVVATSQFQSPLEADQIRKLDSQGALFPTKNLEDPVKKDTITIPRYGAALLRFKADNPGFWILRDERSTQWTRGLDVVLQVGSKSDFVAPPPEFPKCGSYVGPHYFLI